MLGGRNRKFRVISWILAAGAATSLVLVAVSWRDLLVRYHLEALRRNPPAFLSFLDAPAGSVKELALKAFVREPAGRQAVASRFLDDVEQARRTRVAQRRRRGGFTNTLDFFTIPDRALGDVDKAILGFHSKVNPGGSMFWGEFHWGEEAEEAGLFGCLDDTYIIPLGKLLAECRGASLELTAYPGLTVEVLSLWSGMDAARRWTRTLPGRYGLQYAPLPDPGSPQDSVLVLSRLK